MKRFAKETSFSFCNGTSWGLCTISMGSTLQSCPERGRCLACRGKNCRGPSALAELKDLGMICSTGHRKPTEPCSPFQLPLSGPSAPQSQGSKHSLSAIGLLPQVAPRCQPPDLCPMARLASPCCSSKAERLLLRLWVSHTPDGHS